MAPTVSADWLHQHLNDPDLIILDASIEASADGTQTSERHEVIPSARWFDIKNAFSDTSSPFPNTVPTAAQFEQECQKLGINSQHRIVVYDHFGVYSSPRAWWLFKVMGHDHVAVLDGGLPEWKAKGFKTVPMTDPNYGKGNFKANFQPELVIRYDTVKENVINPKFLMVDARASGRFNGTAPEPRAHLKSGHIPHSVNIPYQDVLEGHRFKSDTILKALFDSKCQGEHNLVFSCGSGLTACILMLASNLSYSNSKKVYDGSWTEWADNDSFI
ncbi:MAG: sulfurtransferase [Gelidibacter sp.]